ncbi:hypothetical protein ACF1BS_14940 [Streptomyces sp. NPDC014748]|uniref:hypothetical protein n=1 Tax=Streptomyces sp. NPDC014748 TaxID=3364905 RepID=UPI0036FD6399
MKRRHRAREHTRNEQAYAVRYTYPAGRGLRRTAEFHTSDKAQAYRKAREYKARGWLTSFARHLGEGRWEEIPVTAPDARKAATR